ncbi:hypothetical protein H2203_000830 [Taxawa tesnikishii (nom. ined.)]|nr:hypothetical protein H2203_000830 [Dothideales sp. JES 119]
MSSSPISSTTSEQNTPSQPIQIGFTPSGTDALLDIFPSAPSTSSYASQCAFPSWPSGSRLFSSQQRMNIPNSYISDEDLFGDLSTPGDDHAPYLTEAPEPPRPAEAWLAEPLLPLIASERPRRRSSKKETRPHLKPTRSSPKKTPV